MKYYILPWQASASMIDRGRLYRVPFVGDFMLFLIAFFRVIDSDS
nr:hypothetical protein Q903MT_gene5972 [Picea sitchensis]